MKLPANNANHIKIPLSCLKITDNVRMNFDEAEIEELANSIRQNGLMNPITVRPPETDADGNKTYEVIAGGRRIRAHQWLCEHGDDFSLIECCIRTGDKWALQMIENIQRTDLTPREKENAVAKALEEGLTQTQIADKLSKPIQWVSDIVAGAKIRKIADAAGLNTEEITTKTLSQLRSIPDAKLQNCLKELIAEGGTYRAATRMMQKEKNPATTHVSTPDNDFISEEQLPDGLNVGDEIVNLGKRLFFKDLFVGKHFILNVSTESMTVYELCKVVRINNDHAYFSDGSKASVNAGASVSQLFVDGADKYNWIYDISDETIATSSIVSYEPEKEKNPAITHVSTPDEEFISDDESMISPSEMSEEDFHDDVDFEKNRKESRFVVGTEIDIAGERLFFKNLWHGRYVILKIDGKNIVCLVSSSIYTETVSFFYRENEDFSKDRTVKLSVSEIDSEIENEQYNIYAIPDNAKAIRKPDLSKKNDSDLEEKTKQKGFANPVSKEIQKRWVVFCRDKKIPESDKTAFKFYQELTRYFENTRKN